MNTARHRHILAVGLILCGALDAANNTYPLKIGSANPRILVDQNNVPFLMVGDSPHSVFSNLSSARAAVYLADRKERGINCLWVNMLCIRPVEGRPDGSLLNGTQPFTRMIPGTRYYDLTAPNEAYFDHVAEVIQMAANDGIVMMSDPLETAGWLPTALANGATRCRTYERYLGTRYRDFPNIIWLHGNDFQNWSEPTNDAVITAVARGIKDEDPNHFPLQPTKISPRFWLEDGADGAAEFTASHESLQALEGDASRCTVEEYQFVLFLMLKISELDGERIGRRGVEPATLPAGISPDDFGGHEIGQ